MKHAARPIIVQKYGGSSVADVDKIGKVADRVAAARRAGHDVVVVVSAMGKTTDGLLALANKAAAWEGGAADPPRRELDMLLSTGERVSMALLSIAIQARGFEAISFTGSQSGILTNDRHFDARIIEVRPHRIEDELSRGRIVIVAVLIVRRCRVVLGAARARRLRHCAQAGGCADRRGARRRDSVHVGRH